MYLVLKIEHLDDVFDVLLICFRAIELKREHDVFHYVKHGNKIERLEYESDLASS